MNLCNYERFFAKKREMKALGKIMRGTKRVQHRFRILQMGYKGKLKIFY